MPSQMLEGRLFFSGEKYISVSTLVRLGLRDKDKPRSRPIIPQTAQGKAVGR